jgi:23S rRNA pseudouridine1911/1915/1917 synthase
MPEILFEDEYLIAINKPAGVLTIPDRFNPEIPNLMAMLKPVYPDIIPVHRIDKFTSGINLFAKNAESHYWMSELFQSHKVEKYYTAIVDGIPYPESGRIDVPITESTITRGKMLVHKRGKASITDYKIMHSYGQYSLLHIRIRTGRMHQVRVHMQYLGHPLIVDSLYGNREAFYLSEIKHKKMNLSKYKDELPLLSRQPLHAHRLCFKHAVTGKNIEINCDVPKDISAVINQMRKWLQ